MRFICSGAGSLAPTHTAGKHAELKRRNQIMKSKLFRLLSVMLVGAGALVLQPAQAAKVRVVTTLTDLADLTREIGGQYVDVSSLATGVEDTHGVPMKPSFVPMMN